MTDGIVAELRSLKTRRIIFERPDCHIFQVKGPDSIRYLHNRLTQDIKSIASGTGARSLLLSPNGRVQGSFIVFRSGEDVFLISDEIDSESILGTSLAALMQFKVADQLELIEADESFRFYSICSDSLPEIKSGEVLGVYSRPKRFTGIMDILSRGPAEEKFISDHGLIRADTSMYEAVRILSAEPRFGVDTSDRVLGPELDISHLVSFDKGCYPGQEVVEMSIARGRPNRKFVQISAFEPLQVGEEIIADEKSVGSITGSLFFPKLPLCVALAFIKSDSLHVESFISRSGVRCLLSNPETIVL